MIFNRCVDMSRFSWNWGLAQRLEQYKNNTSSERFTDAMKQHKEINCLKKMTFNWMYNYSKCIPQEALHNLDQAIKNFVNGRKKGRKVGFPRFKKKQE